MMPHWFSPFGRVWGGHLSQMYVAFSALNFIGDDETANLRDASKVNDVETPLFATQLFVKTLNAS
jgi:hypothetical protein